MNKKINIAAALAAAATVALTACDTTAETVPAPSSGPAPTVTVPELRLATGMDRTAAEAALRDGKPYLVGLPDGTSVACHSALLVPGDSRPWILNAPIRPEGSAFESDYAQVGCSGRSVPAPTTAPAPPAAMDTSAAEAAKAKGRPFIYALPDGNNPNCNAAVIVDGEKWFLNRSSGPTASGNALSKVQRGYGCTAGEVVPGVPASTNPN
ncbi:hypothetical protein [Mycobacteroides abscessus]|uniref:hypothetical protein n=1 Tax=Mycobacteroides abscessus TaxID=36809 RepID=UPI00092670C1|nr:hypothetical protein [Mycobacteroides abscessus]MBE5451235.1 hypothetical protein [Mycobacteroides abscessus]MDO3352110.1 hypothetical protein [Mycobacteroides abscessus subsp. abscessus]PVA12460.1 hypothetical protein DDJ61_22985 [Mycobacteroides abscessus]PVA74365.1 hypothetical protein DDJ76_22320 [Mycobacteroides abscessus]RIR90323.1 hypothetical protein D2E50_15365 [Mycobacteroides abscessus]